jgi:hypothetical protein
MMSPTLARRLGFLDLVEGTKTSNEVSMHVPAQRVANRSAGSRLSASACSSCGFADKPRDIFR